MNSAKLLYLRRCVDADALKAKENVHGGSDTLIALLTLQGYEVRRTAAGGYLIQRWGHYVHARDWTAARAFYLRAVGADVKGALMT